MNCCSTGLAVSAIIHVDAPPQILWDVLTDIEAYPNFVETIKRTRIQLPSKSVACESSTTKRVQVGTNIYEDRCKKRHKDGTAKKMLKMRRIVTKVIESPSTSEYSISFSTQFDDVYPRHVDLLCNTSTLSIMPSTTPADATGVSHDSNSCKLVGSLALEVGGAGTASLSSILPIFSIACCKRKVKTHAERHFEEELSNYGTEAERRYQHRQQQNIATSPTALPTTPK